MSIENQLKAEFQQYAKQLPYPRQLDERVHRLMNGTAGKSLRKRKMNSRIALIAACIFLFSGIAYASNVLYTMQTNKISWELSSNAAVQLPDSVNAEIRASLQNVRSELVPGESAVVYVAELEKRKLPALTKVTRPAAYTDLEQWAALASKGGAALKKPGVLPQGFTLSRGELEAPVGLIDADSFGRYSKLLKQQAADSKQRVAWQRLAKPDSGADSVASPGLIYANPNNEQIEIRYQVMPSTDQKISMNISTGTSTKAEKVAVSGHDAYFTVNDATFLSDTGKQSTVSWMEELSGGQTVVYQVSTESPNVSKEDLLAVANGLK